MRQYPNTPLFPYTTLFRSTFHNGTLSVTKAALSITADDKTKVYGDANPALTASYVGLDRNSTRPNSTTPNSPYTAAYYNNNMGTYTITTEVITSGNYDNTL